MMLAGVLRSLLRARGFSVAVGLTLAVGIGALTTTVAVVNAALFREPPFEEADRLALLFIDRNPKGETPYRERWSFARSELLRQQQKSFEDIATYAPGSLTLSGDANSELVEAERVSASYFPLLRQTAAQGRLFTEAEDDSGKPGAVAVLGHRLWTRRFAADPAILGRTVRVNGVTMTVVGVMPPDFAGLSGRSQLWVPRTMTPQLTYAEFVTTNQNFISAFGRLKPGIDFTAAQSELAVLGASINHAIPSDPDDPGERVTASATLLNDARVDKNARKALFVLLSAVALLHLLACANAVNLLLGRMASRRRDSAVRVALGSSNRRLFGQLFAEGSALVAVAGVIGIAGAALVSTFISPPANVWAARNFYGSLAAFDALSFGAIEMAAGLAVTLMTVLLVAVLPALAAFHIDVSSGIKAGSRSIAGGGLSLRRPSPRGVIVGFEAALAMLLVVTAGLLIDSFERMRRTGIGVDTEKVLTFWVIPSEARVLPAQAPIFVTRVLDAVSRVPGVESASVDGGGPVSGTALATLQIAGRPAPAPGQAPVVTRHYVGDRHFQTLGIPLMRGRSLNAGDTAQSPRVTVISESAAKRFWPNEDPIGKRVWFPGGSAFNTEATSAEIVGVVADVVYAPLDQRRNNTSFYTPYTQFTYPSRMVFVRTTGDPMSVVAGVRSAIASVDPELALRDVKPLSEVVTGSRARSRFDAFLFGGFGLAALLLAASGIFAVLSYAVATRTREFGVRIALGADTRNVLWHVLREGLAFPVAGLMLGVAAALSVTRLLQSSLYEVSAREPRVFVGTAALLLGVAAAACLLPAWRATRTDPMEALRAE